MKLLQKLALAYLTALVFFLWGVVTVKQQWFPYRLIEPVYSEVHAFFSESHRDSLLEMARYEHQERASAFTFSGLRRSEPGFTDTGFLLLAGYSADVGQSIVELLSLAENRVIHRWVPNLDAIFALTPKHRGGVNTRAAYRSQHPLLLENGDLVISSGEGPLVRIDGCGNPVWAIDRHFHHSIERDAFGRLLVPVVTERQIIVGNTTLLEDAVAVVSMEGELLAELPLYSLFEGPEYRALLHGVGQLEADRFHLNDVQPLFEAGQQHIALLSIRNLSTVAALNLSTWQIEWTQTGPWLNQHDVNPLADGRISVFGNDLVRDTGALLGAGHSDVYFYDPGTGVVTTPFSGILARVDMRTPYEGRARRLANGDLFIEETNRDRLLRLSPDALRWEYVNAVSETTTGALHWSRYIEAYKINANLLGKLVCEKSSS